MVAVVSTSHLGYRAGKRIYCKEISFWV